jgi:hypothetical protein
MRGFASVRNTKHEIACHFVYYEKNEMCLANRPLHILLAFLFAVISAT